MSDGFILFYRLRPTLMMKTKREMDGSTVSTARQSRFRFCKWRFLNVKRIRRLKPLFTWVTPDVRIRPWRFNDGMARLPFCGRAEYRVQFALSSALYNEYFCRILDPLYYLLFCVISKHFVLFSFHCIQITVCSSDFGL